MAILDRAMLLLSAFNLVPQAIPMLWQQKIVLEMLSETERLALGSSDFASWCVMSHLGCLLLVLAALCLLACATFRLKERRMIHAVMFVYNGSSIFYHRSMYKFAGGVPTWFADPNSFWFNVYAILFSTAINGIGLISALMDTEAEAKAKRQ
eukprot:TRINITY_DN51035_c0_g1_i1.p1 TRINITY_DN51035_c0_g1~~TRINITY_DN51035_c0_g1_i1.p1  ORF type:complete len:152 (-),score=24.20 TRINITY_DN51035_c0_g1_i1:293-748(-)